MHVGQRRIRFIQPLNDTSAMIRAALNAVGEIYHWGVRYKQGGVFLGRIIPEDSLQGDLFLQEDIRRRRRLNRAVDRINLRHGADSIGFASTGLVKLSAWRTTFNHRSPAYTTRWDQLPPVD